MKRRDPTLARAARRIQAAPHRSRVRVAHHSSRVPPIRWRVHASLRSAAACDLRTRRPSQLPHPSSEFSQCTRSPAGLIDFNGTHHFSGFMSHDAIRDSDGRRRIYWSPCSHLLLILSADLRRIASKEALPSPPTSYHSEAYVRPYTPCFFTFGD